MNKRFLFILIFLIAAIVTAGCDAPKIEMTPEPTQIVTKEPTPEPTEAPTEEPMPEATEEMLKALNQDLSEIVVLRETMGEYDDFKKLIEKMNDAYHPFYITETGGKRGIIANDDVVLLKVNAQWNYRGGTNTDLIDSVIQAILDHPDGFRGEIIVADNGQGQYGSFGTGGSLDWKENNSMDTSQSAQDVVNKYFGEHKVSTYLWDTITKNEVAEFSDGDMEDGFIVYDHKDEETGMIVSYPKFTTDFGTKVSFKYGIWDEDAGKYNKDNFKVINMPVLKSHGGYGITACIKNYMGVPSDKLTRTNAHFSIEDGGMGTLMAETTIPALNILDAIWINPIRGPRTEYYKAVNTQIVAVSTDPFALDYWASEQILIPEAEIVGNTNLNKMSLEVNSTSRNFGNWARLSLDELISSGHIMRFGSENVAVLEAD